MVALSTNTNGGLDYKTLSEMPLEELRVVFEEHKNLLPKKSGK